MNELAAAVAALHLALLPSVPCEAPPGTIVAAIQPSGGDGKAVSLQLSGDVADFAIRGSNIVVGAAGITRAHCGSLRTVTITATQP